MTVSTVLGIELVAVLRLVGHGGPRRWGPNPWLVSISPAAPVDFFFFFVPCLTPAANGASDPLAWCQGRATKSLGSGWGLFVKVCSFVRVNFLSIIVSHNVYKTSTLI